MKILLLVTISICLSLMQGCGPPATQKISENINPVVAALEHFTSLSELARKGQTKKESVLVDAEYEVNGYFLDAALSAKKWPIPRDAKADMIRRISNSEKLDASPFSASSFQVVDFGDDFYEYKISSSKFNKKYPLAQCLLKLWPLGFTDDGTQAIVCFQFGPTAHGAIAAYLLENHAGLWRVINYKVSYFA